MKKMKLSASAVGTIEVLTRAQLKNVMGGVANCAAYFPSGSGASGFSYTAPVVNINTNSGAITLYGITSTQAQSYANSYGSGAHWCCSSCASASWY